MLIKLSSTIKKTEYLKQKKIILNIAKKKSTEKECLGVIQFYLSSLRDNHQKLEVTNDYYPFKTFQDSISVKRFLDQNVENFKLKGTTDKGILGNWYYQDGTFAIEIQKNLKKGRNYIGALTADFVTNKIFLGTKGDLKIEFYQNSQKELYAVYWSFGQVPSVFKVDFTDDTLRLGRSLVFYKDKSKLNSASNYKVQNATFFKVLSQKTNYLRIHTFDFGNKKNIDSIILKNQEKLSSKENLIIDIRNNGGGSDLSYYPILPFIMDKKTYQSPITASSIWVSKDNFQDYYDERYLYDVTTKQYSLNSDKEIEELRKHIGAFEPYTRSTTTIGRISEVPRKVFIIQNRNVASSSEGFILAAKQSEKVKTFGENTGGFVAYGEWRKLEIPKLPAWISMTQKKMIFYDDSDFEMIGIEADVKLNPDDEVNWINIIKKEIEK